MHSASPPQDWEIVTLRLFCIIFAMSWGFVSYAVEAFSAPYPLSNDPVTLDGKALLNAIHAHNLPLVKIILERGLIVVDGYYDQDTQLKTSFLRAAIMDDVYNSTQHPSIENYLLDNGASFSGCMDYNRYNDCDALFGIVVSHVTDSLAGEWIPTIQKLIANDYMPNTGRGQQMILQVLAENIDRLALTNRNLIDTVVSILASNKFSFSAAFAAINSGGSLEGWPDFLSKREAGWGVLIFLPANVLVGAHNLWWMYFVPSSCRFSYDNDAWDCSVDRRYPARFDLMKQIMRSSAFHPNLLNNRNGAGYTVFDLLEMDRASERPGHQVTEQQRDLTSWIYSTFPAQKAAWQPTEDQTCWKIGSVGIACDSVFSDRN